MRTVLIGDIIAAARAIIALPAPEQPGFMETILDQAHAAHSFHKRLLKPHPAWGNGSLMARANKELQIAEPFASDAAYLLALHTVIGALIARRMRIAGQS